MKKNKKYYIRKIHRYLGLFIGIQFLGWTVSGLYFSWTDIDEIHGDQFMTHSPMTHTTTSLIAPNEIDTILQISSLNLRFINHKPFYWVNDSLLFDAENGERKNGVTSDEAKGIAKMHLAETLTISSIELLTETGQHHEFRGRPLPAWAISFDDPDNLVAYVDARNGKFERIRHSSWRIFDFLWMFHTMDYAGRDNFNNWLLRAFSIFGLLAVLSGFVLYTTSSQSLIKYFKTKK